MEEIWKDIENYEGLYQVSNLGNVRSLDREVNYRNGSTKLLKGRVLKFLVSGNTPYRKVVLNKDGKGKTFFVHTLVANAFLDKLDSLGTIIHKDGCPTNNVYTNLEWILKDSCKSEKVKSKTVRKRIKIRCITTGEIFTSVKKAEQKYNCDLSSDYAKLKIKFRRHIGKSPEGLPLKWEYI